MATCSSVKYYSWSQSSGTCTPGTTKVAYTTSGTRMISSNDYDGTSSNPCGYTFYLAGASYYLVPPTLASYVEALGTLTYSIYTNNSSNLKYQLLAFIICLAYLSFV